MPYLDLDVININTISAPIFTFHVWAGKASNPFRCLHVVRQKLSFLLYTNNFELLQVVSVGRRQFSAEYQLVFRLIKGLIFLSIVSVLITLIALPHMTFLDVIVCILAFMPTGWGLLLVRKLPLIFQIFSPFLEELHSCTPVVRCNSTQLILLSKNN